MSGLMFPEAPTPTVPITLLEDTDLDFLLVEFPNHLVIHTVMEHFCAAQGGQSAGSGYLASAMATRLSVHHNRDTLLDFDAADRLGKLITWIQKMKKSTNAARRRRKAAGQNVELVPFEGQCIPSGGERTENTEESERDDNGGAPTPLGLRLKQRADEAVAEYAKMMAAKPESATSESRDAKRSSSRDRGQEAEA
jgi:hypothetical protein